MKKTYVVTSAIIKNGDKFFIAKRADTKRFAPGHWEFISGFIKEAKPVEETILRELKEEINAEGKIEKSLKPYFFDDSDGRWLVVPFLITIKNPNIQTNPSEHSEGRWVTWEELQQMLGSDLQQQMKELKSQI